MASRSPEPSEHSYQLAIQEHLALRYARDIYAWRNNSGALPTTAGRFVHFGKVGSSDILGFWLRGPNAGKIIALEVKRPSTRNKATTEQKAFLEAVQQSGGFGGVVVTVADVDQVLGSGNEAE